jgi:hypothetical protein
LPRERLGYLAAGLPEIAAQIVHVLCLDGLDLAAIGCHSAAAGEKAKMDRATDYWRSMGSALVPKFHIPRLCWADQKTIYAMSGEDGIIERILSALPPTSRSFVEVGINLNADILAKENRRVLQGNAVALHEQGWRGWWFDGNGLPDFPITVAFITPLNINTLWRENNIPEEVDLFSLDIDGMDFWVWMALNAKPRVVILEVNAHFDPQESKTIAWNIEHVWQGDTYYGASLAAMTKLSADKGYTLVYWNGANAFYIRTDLMANPQDFVYEELASRADYHPPHPPGREWVSI